MKRLSSGINPGDRISALPDSILSLILSFLPTNNVVLTCLVSKRWEFLWKTVINLDFCHVESGHESDMKFAWFVTSVLLLHDVRFLNKFRLVWKSRCTNPSQINPWITTAITRQVRELVVCLESSDRPFQMSSSIFNCDTLQYLEFNGCVIVSASIIVCLPRLESLKLDSVCFQSEEAFEKLISGCPMLKYLHLVFSVENTSFHMPPSVFNCSTLQSLELKGYVFVSAGVPVCLPRLESLKFDSACFQSEKAFEKLIRGCPMLKYLIVRINIDKMTEYLLTDLEGIEVCEFKFVVSSASLRHLELYFVSVDDGACLHSNLELNVSYLEYLTLVGYISRIHVQESLSFLVEAYFGIKVCECEWTESGVGISLMKALDACYAKVLTLSGESMWAINEACYYKGQISLWPNKFKRLVKLKALSDCCHTNVLRDLLQSSDGLEVMILDKLISCGNEGEGSPNYPDYPYYHAAWNPPKEVPICLSSSLKSIEFTCYGGYRYELEMVGYMLEHGSVLEIMKISCAKCKEDRKYEFLLQISKLPRKSPTCKIEFSTGGTFAQVRQ